MPEDLVVDYLDSVASKRETGKRAEDFELMVEALSFDLEEVKA